MICLHCILWTDIKVTCKGTPGHGALASEMGTAGDKVI